MSESDLRILAGLALNAATDDEVLDLPTINGHDDEDDDAPDDGIVNNGVAYDPGEEGALGLPVINWSQPPDGSIKPRDRGRAADREYRSRDIVHNRGDEDDALDMPSVDWSKPI